MAGFAARNRGKLSVALAVVAVLGVGVVLYGQLRGARPLPNTVKFVCVATGKTYGFDRTRTSTVLPARNPDTGERTLLPCYAKDGALYVVPRYSSALTELGDKNQYVDTETLAVQPPR